jgi:hypothetical protein
MAQDEGPYQEGKRAGLHPLVVVFGILLGLWLFVALIVPSSRNKQATGTEGPAGPVVEDPEAAPVIFKVHATVPDMNAVSLVVPPQATESQVVGLLKRLKKERLAGTLRDLIPATTPGHKLGDHAVAEIYVLSDPTYAEADVIRTLSRGARSRPLRSGHGRNPRALPHRSQQYRRAGHRIDRVCRRVGGSFQAF